MNEILNKLIIKIEYLITFHLKRILHTTINKIFARLKGVQIGSGLTTYGRLFFHRAPNSNIIIGKNCDFRSSKLSNLIGINKFCILATQKKNATLSIGDNCGFSGVSIGCREYIKIGSNVLVGANVIITDTDWHSLKIKERRSGEPKTAHTIIENNVFIGVNSIILKGSHIGENSVIGAGSIVSGTIPANVVAAGNPCRILKTITNQS